MADKGKREEGRGKREEGNGKREKGATVRVKMMAAGAGQGVKMSSPGWFRLVRLGCVS